MKHLIANSLLFLSLSVGAVPDPRGNHADGSLVDPECLQETGEGYMQLFRDVERIWGTSELVSMIVNTGKDMNSRFPGRDRLQVEDMSDSDGGSIEGHSSHENGLDVDLQYFKADGIEHVPKHRTDYAPSMVNKDGSLSENFDVQRNWELMKSLHRNGNVGSIFVDRKLKAVMCDYARSKGELRSHANVLRSMAHIKNHSDHLHVRLKCPASARNCRNAPLPSDPGCK